jgi:hypothetical protein
MTAPTRSTIAILAVSQNAAGTTTKAAPGIVGPWVDVRGLNGGVIAWSVKNGTAPGAPGQFTVQGSDVNDGTNITDIWGGGGDIVLNSESTGMFDLPATVSYVRMICWGNTTNPVTFKSNLFAKA